MKKTKFCFSLLIILSSCRHAEVSEEDVAAIAQTPVTITGIAKEMLKESVELNAVSSFLLKTNLKVNASGYLQKVNVKLGDYVNRGDELFSLKTKEATTLGNTLNQLDSGFHFKGIISVKATGNGYVTNIAYQAGDYVQDGELVATISDAESFVFILDLPYELTPLLPQNNVIQLKLPDGTMLDGKIEKAMPTADPVSQTQSFAIKINTHKMIPENLIAKVEFIKRAKVNAVSVPKEAVLTNESQSEFWIMRLLNDSIAIKIPVHKGMETATRVEILSPVLSETDRIVLTGNYGLTDTAKVKIKNN
jgi:multidrug efflux pump subunit AcrA (membrane-fusion protein)